MPRTILDRTDSSGSDAGDKIETNEVQFSLDANVSDSDVLEALYGTGQENDVPDILGRNMSQGVDLHSIISEVAKHYISRAISDSNGNKSDAAKLVGLPSYQTLSNWMNKYGIT